jgi:protein-arginine kinase activator protein McsA
MSWCDLCKVNFATTPLIESYKTTRINKVCDGCANEINELHNRTLELMFDYKSRMIKRFARLLRLRKRSNTMTVQGFSNLCLNCKGKK